MYVIADASEDAHAAKMLGTEISTAISLAKKPFRIEETVKAVMGKWFNGYHHVQPPQIQFLLAFTQESWDSVMLYYCEPPNTVAHGSNIAIGKGSRVVDPALDIFRPTAKEKLDAKSALIKLAYLMHLAKRDEGVACGGDTYAIVMGAGGAFAFVDEEEMRQAERISKKLSDTISTGLRKITSLEPNDLLTTFPGTLEEIGESYRKLPFKSLDFMERSKIWKVGTVG